ncbi:Voltage-gated potassium channel subunit beta-2, partial [Temnothorax longispinosus]
MSRLMLCNLGNTSAAGNDTNNNANTNSSMEDDDSYPLPTIYRCRAPIASLDCMEEFNGGGGVGGGVGGGGGVDSGVHCSNTTGTKEQLLTSCIAAQAQRLQHPSPGIRYRNLGKSGLRVSNVGLAPNKIDNICLFLNRTEGRGLSRKHIIESVQASLVRLQLSYIDIVMIHKVDPMCPMEGVGLMAWSTVTIGMVSSKPEDCGNKYSSFSWTEDETQSLYKEEYAWKDKSADEETRKYSDKLRDVYALAERLGCSFGQLAIAWSLKNESVQCLLLGASNIDQLYESLQSLQ